MMDHHVCHSSLMGLAVINYFDPLIDRDLPRLLHPDDGGCSFAASVYWQRHS
jgi:hypothetical protein